MSGLYGTPGWDEPDDGEDYPYDDDPPDARPPRPRKPLIRGGAGKRKGKSPHQHVRNWRFTMPHTVTFMRDTDYDWYRLVIGQFKNKPIDVRKLWRKKIQRHRLNRHRLKAIEF